MAPNWRHEKVGRRGTKGPAKGTHCLCFQHFLGATQQAEPITAYVVYSWWPDRRTDNPRGSPPRSMTPHPKSANFIDLEHERIESILWPPLALLRWPRAYLGSKRSVEVAIRSWAEFVNRLFSEKRRLNKRLKQSFSPLVREWRNCRLEL